MNNSEITIDVSVTRTPRRFAQWVTTMYKELYKTEIEIQELTDLSSFRDKKFVEQLDRLICQQIPPTKDIQRIWNQARKQTLFVKSRKRELSDGRKLAAMILREKKFTLTGIGLIMGKDHSTIIHNIASAESLLETDSIFRRMYHNVKFALDYEKTVRTSSEKEIDSQSTIRA